MMLRRYLTILMLMALVGSLTCHADQSKTYNLSGFTGVNASFAVDVELTQGDAFSVLAITESDDFDGLELRVEDGVLIATRPEELWGGKNTSSWWQFFDLVSGNKNISTERVNGHRVININGERVPAYTVRVTAPSISQIVASTNGIVTAKEIKTRDLTVKASSSGDVKADKLISRQLDLRATSSSNIRAKASGGDVSLVVSSSGDVDLSGTCNELDIKATSGSNVKANDLTCQKGNLNASSGADIIAVLTETVEARASSGGDIMVSGGATLVNLTESSGGDVSISEL